MTDGGYKTSSVRGSRRPGFAGSWHEARHARLARVIEQVELRLRLGRLVRRDGGAPAGHVGNCPESFFKGL